MKFDKGCLVQLITPLRIAIGISRLVSKKGVEIEARLEGLQIDLGGIETISSSEVDDWFSFEELGPSTNLNWSQGLPVYTCISIVLLSLSMVVFKEFSKFFPFSWILQTSVGNETNQFYDWSFAPLEGQSLYSTIDVHKNSFIVTNSLLLGGW